MNMIRLDTSFKGCNTLQERCCTSWALTSHPHFPHVPPLSPYLLISLTSQAHSHPTLISLALLAGTLLHQLGTLLSRVEDLSHVLVWGVYSGASAADGGACFTLAQVELPRLKLRFRPVGLYWFD